MKLLFVYTFLVLLHFLQRPKFFFLFFNSTMVVSSVMVYVWHMENYYWQHILLLNLIVILSQRKYKQKKVFFLPNGKRMSWHALTHSYDFSCSAKFNVSIQKLYPFFGVACNFLEMICAKYILQDLKLNFSF